MKSYAEMAAAIGAVEKMGTWIHLSGMFGTKSTAQGCVIAMECYINNIPVMEYQRRNGLMMGRPYVPYDATAAAFEESGGKIKLIARTADLAKAEFTWNGILHVMEFSWEDAKKEPVVYEGKESDVVDSLLAGKSPKLKSKYATPRSRATMLWARLISDSVKAIAPKCNFGTYSLEEVEDFDPSELASIPLPVSDSPAESVRQVVQQIQQVEQSQPQSVQQVSQVNQTESVSVAPQEPSAAVDPNTPDPYSQALSNGPAIEEQREQVVSLLRGFAQEGKAGLHVVIGDALKAADIAGGVLGLTYAEADGLINSLRNGTLEKWAKSELIGHVKASAKNG